MCDAGGREKHYTLQHINGYVFKEPLKVMRNIERVTAHLRKSLLSDGLDPDRRVLSLIPAQDGGSIYRDEKDDYWRVYRFIENATAYDKAQKPAHFFEAGRAFGEFQKRLCDFPVDELYETIPDFHNTTRRFYAFVHSLSQDQAGRAEQVEEEIEFFFERRRMMNEIVKRQKAGLLPVRVTHNDTKINNVMIDNATDEAICVIDLDTVMPGSSLYDFGDAIRFGASAAKEDEEDLSKVYLDMDSYERFTRGFLAQTDGFLLPEELRLLPLGVKVITCELAMRFLADYIDGDRYFKVRSPEHNLIRARAQMKLLTDIERKEPEMQAIIGKLIAS